MDHILEFWDSQAETHLIDHSASWGDLYMLEIERLFLVNLLKKLSPKNVLDAGTSNGHSLIEIARQFPDIAFEGFDFSPSMVKMCNLGIDNSCLSNIQKAFCADIRSLDSLDNSYDFIFTTRVLINLPTWEEQKSAINQLLSKLASGGSLVIMEGFWEPLMRINALRTISHLSPLREHDFNRYIKQANINTYLNEAGLTFETVDFSSTYYLLTRFVREAIGADLIDYSYTSQFNLDSKCLQDKFKNSGQEGFGIQQAYIIKAS